MTTKPVVLIVDDEPFLLDIVRRVLVRNGYTVLSAADGSEAIALYRASDVPIAAVVLDLSMPGMDGVDTYLELRKIDENVRVLLASGYGEIDTRERAGRQLDCIGKPYSPSVLIERLERLWPGFDDDLPS
ncbi:MAG: response regulator [Deltaproteobacteria bacterium]